jgi:hypothetical protein
VQRYGVQRRVGPYYIQPFMVPVEALGAHYHRTLIVDDHFLIHFPSSQIKPEITVCVGYAFPSL